MIDVNGLMVLIGSMLQGPAFFERGDETCIA